MGVDSQNLLRDVNLPLPQSNLREAAHRVIAALLGATLLNAAFLRATRAGGGRYAGELLSGAIFSRRSRGQSGHWEIGITGESASDSILMRRYPEPRRRCAAFSPSCHCCALRCRGFIARGVIARGSGASRQTADIFFGWTTIHALV